MEAKKILIVDDEENAREGLAKILKKTGYITATAENGEEALSILENSRYDLVITDIKMPRMDGMQLLKKMRKIAPDIGVIMVTAYGEVESYLEAMSQGAFEYLNKPMKIDELKKVINKVLQS
ncbi:MAG: response regulator [bacterium]